MMFRRRNKNLWIAIAVLLGLSYCSAYNRSYFLYLQGRYLVPVWTVPVAPVPVAPVAVPPVLIPPGWTHVTSPGARLSVLLPTTTVKEARESSPPFVHSFAVDIGIESFWVSAFELSLQELGMARQIIEDSVNQRFDGFKIVSKRSFSLNGSPGIEINLSTKAPSNLKGTVRRMVVGNRLYTLTVYTDTPERARIFFDSFRPM